jgi:hypothetical protein
VSFVDFRCAASPAVGPDVGVVAARPRWLEPVGTCSTCEGWAAPAAGVTSRRWPAGKHVSGVATIKTRVAQVGRVVLVICRVQSPARRQARGEHGPISMQHWRPRTLGRTCRQADLLFMGIHSCRDLCELGSARTARCQLDTAHHWGICRANWCIVLNKELSWQLVYSVRPRKHAAVEQRRT